ncbi:MAG: dCMP deaminase family protein [archaeon]
MFSGFSPKRKRRVSFDETYMRQAYEWAKRSTCRRRQVGAVISKDNRFVSQGYNGAVKGEPHCLDVGCLREQLNIPSGERHEMCRGAHAEQNSLMNARDRDELIDAIMYCTTYPCSHCAKEIVQQKIKRVYYYVGYKDELSQEILDKVEVIPFSGVMPLSYPRFWG